MRLVHVCRSDGFAGVERHVADLASAQAEAGHDVVVVGGDPERMGDAASEVVLLKPAARTIDVTAQLLRLPRPDIIHAHMTAAEVGVALAPSLRTVPTFCTRHFAARRGARLWTRPVVALAASRIRAEIAVSDYVARHVEGPTTVIHSGVPNQPDSVPAAERQRTVLLAQRLEPEKRTALALEAFARAGLSDRGWRMQVAGAGSLASELEQRATSLGIAVDFLGPRSDVDRLLRTCGIFIAPCAHEAFGLSAVEAMAAGAPVVAAGGGGHVETVGSVDDRALFAPDDANDAANRLVDLAVHEAYRDTYSLDLQRAQRKRFTLWREAEQTISVYRKLL